MPLNAGNPINTTSTTFAASDKPILTGSIRRAILGFIIVGCVLAAIQSFAVTRLQREIDQWAWTSEVNGLREVLLTRTNAFLDGGSNVDQAEILDLFADLEASILSRPRGSGQDSFAARVLAIEKEAHAFFLGAEQRRRAIAPLLQENRLLADSLQELNGSWLAQLRAHELRLQMLSNQNETSGRTATELRSTLTSVLLTAQVMQQQIIAIERLARTASPELAKSAIDGLSILELPPACMGNELEVDGRICSPNVGRLLVALDELKGAQEGNIAINITAALRALEGYIRAGQGRLRSLSQESAQSFDRGQVLREELSDLLSVKASVSRINRLTSDFRALQRQTETSVAELAMVNEQMRFLISQLRIRSIGVLTLSSVLEGDATEIGETIDAISRNWDAIYSQAAVRSMAMDGFAATMATLSREIEEQAETVRGEATLWVNVYVSNFLISVGFIVAFITGLIWFAKRRLVTPLSRVTGTIINLARGELERPVALNERAFGFDQIGSALEQLRIEMSERQLLLERNREQQRVIAANLSDLERTNEEMEWLALHDPLTGLANRRNADLRLDELSNGPDAEDFCVMQIDIDRFKSVNDTLGHAAGDFVLKTVAGILNEHAPTGAQCYRIGGDEFLVVWSGGVTEDKARALSHELVHHIKLPMMFDDHRCNVGASIGIAFGCDAGGDAMQAVMNADLALYDIKRKGRDGSALFTEDFARRAARRKDVSDRLVVAIENKTFQPFYQPQFDAKTRKLRGVEVLCRWHADGLGWVAPFEFLSVAEDLGLVAAIDEILVDKVSLELETLAELGMSLPRVSFNVTADRLLKSNLAPELSRKIGKHATVALELLESMSLDNPTESVNWAIDALKDHGIEIEIDDFGSDRASLAGLMAINPKAMKIDRSIVIPIVESARHRDLVKKILDIGAALKIEVVAEGVESEEHARLLGAHGCDVLQGYGLAKPMPFQDLVAFVERDISDRPENTAVNR